VAGHSHHGEPGDDELIPWAARYDLLQRLWWRRGRRWRNHLLDELDLRPGQRVLDVGSGPGRLAFALADRVTPGGSVDGVDGAAEMVRHAERRNRRRKRPVTFTTARAQELPFADATFDAVTCTLVLHHVARDDRPTAAAEMFRVLRPGGRVLVAEFDGSGGGLTPLARLHNRHAEHAGSLKEAVALLESAGFTVGTPGRTTISGMGRVLATRPA
jgi:ubiquinone/menaquinone biosynthesis C-methylase UbiE